VRAIPSAAASLALAASCALGAAPANLPLAPLSSLGKLAPAPSPGSLGPEDVPVPNAKSLLAPAKKVTLGETVDGVTCQLVEKVSYHIHVHLTIFVNGQARVIPYGIGIGPPVEGLNTSAGPFVTVGKCFMWLHTHALDGIIHVESPTTRTYTLAQFFAVWGQPLTRAQVGPAKGKVTVFYDGQVWTGNPGAIPLTSATQIQLDVGRPLVAPEHITFPTSLLASSSGSTTTK